MLKIFSKDMAVAIQSPEPSVLHDIRTTDLKDKSKVWVDIWHDFH